MTYLDEVRLLLERARSNTRYAAGNHGVGFYRIAVSVAYHGAFYAAKAVLAYHREGAKTHKGLASRFHRLAVFESDFPAEIAGLLGEMHLQRLEADHDLSIAPGDWSEESALRAIERTTAFINEVEAWLIRNLPPGEAITPAR